MRLAVSTAYRREDSNETVETAPRVLLFNTGLKAGVNDSYRLLVHDLRRASRRRAQGEATRSTQIIPGLVPPLRNQYRDHGVLLPLRLSPNWKNAKFSSSI